MILSDEEKLALEPEQSYQDWREQYQPESVQEEREEDGNLQHINYNMNDA